MSDLTVTVTLASGHVVYVDGAFDGPRLVRHSYGGFLEGADPAELAIAVAAAVERLRRLRVEELRAQDRKDKEDRRLKREVSTAQARRQKVLGYLRVKPDLDWQAVQLRLTKDGFTTTDKNGRLTEWSKPTLCADIAWAREEISRDKASANALSELRELVAEMQQSAVCPK